ncbi:hypothetical protein [Mycobacterium sp. 1164985.4]|uniref:hypothetical protein n=1 Tax=Mycobacterium sp. 1164985.4 TaxID=1834069 RepID=UPI002692C099
MRLDQASATLTDHGTALVTTATSQPALGTGFAVLGLISLLDLPRDRADRMVALGGAAAAGWYLVRSNRRRQPSGQRAGADLLEHLGDQRGDR